MKFWRNLFSNLPIKIMALVFAAVFWLYAVLERNQTVATELPVSVGKLPPGMVVAGIDTARVYAQLTGKGRDLISLKFRHPEFKLNLTNQNAGRSRIKLTQEHSTLPATVQIKLTRPEYVNVDLDEQARRTVKVNVPTKGKAAQGFVVTSLKVLEGASISGPQEEINLVGAVNTESLNLADANGNNQYRLKLLTPQGRKFQVDPDSVTVALKIEKEESRTFPSVAVSVFKPALFSVAVRPALAQIAVSGPADQVKSLTLQDISASIKVADTMTRGKRQMPCEITLPPSITLVKCEPALFEVDIK
jgi:YbbR domain-containing protein